MATVNWAPSLPYTISPAVILKAWLMVVEVLKTKLWFKPSAGSFGQVELRGLQLVQVCATTGGRIEAAPRRSERV